MTNFLSPEASTTAIGRKRVYWTHGLGEVAGKGYQTSAREDVGRTIKVFEHVINPVLRIVDESFNLSAANTLLDSRQSYTFTNGPFVSVIIKIKIITSANEKMEVGSTILMSFQDPTVGSEVIRQNISPERMKTPVSFRD
jgi:hypothetical protein